MHQYRLFLGLLITCALFLSACDEETCTTESCPNGFCLEGECLGEEEYVDRLGSDFFQAYYLGTWESGNICPSGSDIGEVVIEAGSAADALLIRDLGPDQQDISANFTGTSLVIPEQLYLAGSISGSGGIDTNAQIITLDYTIDLGNGPFACLTSLELQ